MDALINSQRIYKKIRTAWKAIPRWRTGGSALGLSRYNLGKALQE